VSSLSRRIESTAIPLLEIRVSIDLAPATVGALNECLVVRDGLENEPLFIAVDPHSFGKRLSG
jgi:hypothetical protein